MTAKQKCNAVYYATKVFKAHPALAKEDADAQLAWSEDQFELKIAGFFAKQVGTRLEL